ncbi:LysM peptidoglycan-binding domain-containing protein [bacterium]|nr:LysM peptidoglycan-binding domain-containing protein [bacterium]
MRRSASARPRGNPGIIDHRSAVRAALVLCLVVWLTGCSSISPTIGGAQGKVTNGKYVCDTYEFEFLIPRGWQVSNEQWPLRSALVTLEGKDNATSGRIIAFDFDPEENLSTAEKEAKMIASVTRRPFSLPAMKLRPAKKPRRLKTAWGSVLETVYNCKEGDLMQVYRIWFISKDKFGLAFVCKTSELLYDLVKPEMEYMLTSLKFSSSVASYEPRVIPAFDADNLAKTIAHLDKQYASASLAVSQALGGDARKNSLKDLRSELQDRERELLRVKRLLELSELEGCARESAELSAKLKSLSARALRLGYVMHDVKYKGETLFQIAKWYTGEPENWPSIAEFNGISPEEVKIGSTIRIPLSLGLKTRKPMPPPRKQRTRKKRVRQKPKETDDMEPVGPQ